MRVIALTGGIASGKSTTIGYFRQLGFATIDCDAIVARLYKQKKVQKKLREKFGTASKKRLATMIFADARKRRQLEQLLHPLVLQEVKKQLQKFKNQGKPLVIVDVPLLFEARLQHLFDSAIVVKSTKEQQLQRLLHRGLSKEEAEQRISSQLPLQEKVKKADFVIDNTGNLKETKMQVKKLAGLLK